MSPEDRDYFDEQLEIVLEAIPEKAKELLENVTLFVEDYPSEKQLREQGIEYRDELCGLHSGIALPNRSINDSGVHTDVVYLFREGLFAQSADEEGYVDEGELRRQIRITVLHELGHHVGLSEDDLRELGYD